MERFACATTILSGEDALSALEEDRGKRILLVTESLMGSDHRVRQVLEHLQPAEVDSFSNIAPEPGVRQAVDGAKRMERLKPELVVAVGGSNVLDCAKAMVCFSKWDAPLTVIPTAAGSGTEVTNAVRLIHDRHSHIFRHSRMHPNRAILDWRFLAGQREIGEGGFELLANSLESYTGKGAQILSGFHGREAFSACWAVLPAAVSGKQWALRKLQIASVLSGMAQTPEGLGLCSALCASLGSLFPLSRGKLAAIVLPAVVSCNAGAAGLRYAELARAAGMGGSNEAAALRNLKTALVRLRRELELPATLAQAGVDPRSVWSNAQRIVELTLEDPDCRNNPVTVDDYMIRRILDAAAGRF